MSIQNLFSERSRDLFAERIEMLKLEATGYPELGIAAMINGMMARKDRVEVLKSFKGNKKIICGRLDPLLDRKNIQNIGYQTNTSVILIDDGHMSWLEQYKEIVKIVHFID